MANLQISKHVLENYRAAQGIKLTPPYLKASLAAYLFGLSKSQICSREIPIKIQTKDQNHIVLFTVAGRERIAPIADGYEELMLREFIDLDSTKSDVLHIKSDQRTVSKYMKTFVQNVYHRLGLQRPHPNYTNRLLDLRIKHLMDNGFDYGSLRKYFVPYKRQPLENSQWKEEITTSLLDRAIGKYKLKVLE